jgi:hypothetical protein
MPRGGARNGAGRKRGSRLASRTRKIAERAAEEGVTPLEVMLKAMKAYLAEGNLDKAAAIAKDAAPYIHPRLAAVQHVAPLGNSLEGFSSEELEELHRALQAVEEESQSAEADVRYAQLAAPPS